MDRITRPGLWSAAGVVCLLLFAGLPALAQEAAQGGCRQECREARWVCHAAARAARDACREACREEDGLCRDDCRRAFHRARRLCGEELAECALACGAELDPQCVAECRQDLWDQLEELEACHADCRDETRAAIERCRERGAGGGGVRACIRRALAAGEQCARDCRRELRCGAGFRSCLEGCVIEE